MQERKKRNLPSLNAGKKKKKEKKLTAVDSCQHFFQDFGLLFGLSRVIS